MVAGQNERIKSIVSVVPIYTFNNLDREEGEEMKKKKTVYFLPLETRNSREEPFEYELCIELQRARNSVEDDGFFGGERKKKYRKTLSVYRDIVSCRGARAAGSNLRDL